MKAQMTLARVASCVALLSALATPGFAEEYVLHSFERHALTDVYYSEGAAFGDLNRDGHVDLIYGPYWFEGPTFEKRHEIYPPKPQPTDFYADNFFTWVYDFNGDGWPDLLVVGLPNTPAFIFENPATGDGNWKKHGVFPSVGNESPQFVDLLGTGKPVLVCTHDRACGFAEPDWSKPLENWTFHAISEKTMPEKLPHGLGVGDLNGDGRLDVLIATGWFEQPANNPRAGPWKFHPVPFTNAYGGAEMHVCDVNGDGRNDVITSLAAHDFGLAWYEQDRCGDAVIFRQHTIVGSRPEQNPYGIVFSELHSVALADLYGDGSQDIITGKTYWSHHKASPMWDAGAVVYAFHPRRTKEGVDWVPQLLDADSGVGRQIRVAPLGGDGLDVLVGGMKGASLLTHHVKKVDKATWEAAQPKPRFRAWPLLRRGPASSIDTTSGAVTGALEGESLEAAGPDHVMTSTQEMSGFHPDHWSGGKQRFWTGAKPGDRLELQVPVAAAGEYECRAVFTMAPDYASVQPLLDGTPLGDQIDLYNFPDVITTGVLTLGRRQLSAGVHKLVLEIIDPNPSAVPSNMVGLDYVQLVPAGK